MTLEEITACGGCCTACARYGGECPGCLATDGRVPEWAQSGRCRVHACARAHGVQFCGLCAAFPCAQLGEMIHWEMDAALHMRERVRETTLYLSDLDGTLLRGDQHTSAFTNDTVNGLAAQGMRFSYATARSFHTASKATRGLNAVVPLIVYNGAFIVDSADGRVLHAEYFTPQQRTEIHTALKEAGVQPIVYSMTDGCERMSYMRDQLHPAARAFMDSRKGDLRDTPVTEESGLLTGDGFYFTCIDEKRRLEPLHERFRDQYRCVYSRDIYSDSQWLEIMPRDATKARAAQRLAKMLGCGRIVAFGDHVNDLPLFEVADECYAVANAVPELKAAATGVIGSNEDDGVARWLAEHA